MWKTSAQADRMVPTRQNPPLARKGHPRAKEVLGSVNGSLVAARHQSLFEVVYHQLRDAIREGKFQPGERLIQAELAKSLGVSRMPVREALHRLSEEGFVEFTPHKGAVVRRPSLAEMEEAWEATRVLLEAAMARTIDRLTDEGLAVVERAHARLVKRASSGRSAELADLNRRFHRAIFETAGLGRLYDCIDILISCYPQAMQASISRRTAEALAEHEEILAALRARDRVALIAAATRHTDHNREAVMRLYEADMKANGVAAV